MGSGGEHETCVRQDRSQEPTSPGHGNTDEKQGLKLDGYLGQKDGGGREKLYPLRVSRWSHNHLHLRQRNKRKQPNSITNVQMGVPHTRESQRPHIHESFRDIKGR